MEYCRTINHRKLDAAENRTTYRKMENNGAVLCNCLLHSKQNSLNSKISSVKNLKEYQTKTIIARHLSKFTVQIISVYIQYVLVTTAFPTVR